MRGDSYRGELSFIQLAIILVKRRYIFIAVFLVLLISSAVFTYFKSPVYQYVTYYVVPDLGVQQNRIFDAETLQSKVELGFWPDTKAKLNKKYPDGIPFSLQLSADSDAGTLRMLSTAETGFSDEVKRTHMVLIERLTESTSADFSKYRKSLEEQIVDVEASIEELRGVDRPGEALARAQQRSYELRDQLALIDQGQVVAVAQRGEMPVSVGKGMLAVSLSIVSFIVALICTYAVEFFILVRRALGERGAE